MQQQSVPALFWEMENAMTATLASPSQGMGKVLQLSTLQRFKLGSRKVLPLFKFACLSQGVGECYSHLCCWLQQGSKIVLLPWPLS